MRALKKQIVLDLHMPKSSVKSGHKAILDSVLLGMPGVVEGKMFGYSAYYVNGKLFACIYRKGVGLKVPEEVAAKLLSEKHIVFFPTSRQTENEGVDSDKSREAGGLLAGHRHLSHVCGVREPITNHEKKEKMTTSGAGIPAFRGNTTTGIRCAFISWRWHPDRSRYCLSGFDL